MADNKVNVMFKRGTLAQFQGIQSFVDGAIYITTDEGGIYLGTTNGAKRLGDYWEVDSVAALNALPNKSTGCLYYVKDVNVLARWNEEKNAFVQINAAGILDVQLDPEHSEGTVVTGIEVGENKDGSRFLKVSKANFATESEFNLLSGKVTGLETKIDNVDAAYKKADSDMQSALLGTDGVLNTHTIKGAYKAADDANTAAGNAQATANAAVEAAGKNAADISALTKVVTDNETDIEKKVSDLDAAYQAADVAVKTEIFGEATATGTYKNIKELSAKLVDVDGVASAASAAAGQNATDIAAHGNRLTELERITDLPTAADGKEQTVTAYVAEQVEAAKKAILTGEANEEIDKAYDTILEIAKYIATDKEGGVAVAEQAATNAEEITKLQGEVAGLKGQDTALNTAIENEATARANADIALRNQILGEESEVSSATYKTIHKLSEQVVAVEGVAAKAASDITTINGTLTGLAAEDERLAGLISGIDSAYQQAVSDLEERLVNGASTSATGDYKNINKLSTQVTAAEGEIDALQEAMTAVEGRATVVENLLTWGSFN